MLVRTGPAVGWRQGAAGKGLPPEHENLSVSLGIKEGRGVRKSGMVV